MAMELGATSACNGSRDPLLMLPSQFVIHNITILPDVHCPANHKHDRCGVRSSCFSLMRILASPIKAGSGPAGRERWRCRWGRIGYVLRRRYQRCVTVHSELDLTVTLPIWP